MIIATLVSFVTLGVVVAAYMEIRKMSEALDRLTAEVSQQTSVIESATTLLATLAQEIRDNVDDSDALNALADQLDTQTNELSAAIAANTAAPAPAEPAPADTPPVSEPDVPTA